MAIAAWTLPLTALIAFIAGMLTEWWLNRTIIHQPQRALGEDEQFMAEAGRHYQPKHAHRGWRYSPHWQWRQR